MGPETYSTGMAVIGGAIGSVAVLWGLASICTDSNGVCKKCGKTGVLIAGSCSSGCKP